MSVSIFATLLTFIAFFPYASEALHGPVRPNPVSWVIWALNGAVLCVGHLLAGGTIAAAGVPFAQCIGPAAIGAIAVFQRTGGGASLSPQERFCAVFAAVGMALTVVSRNPLLALTCGIGVECLAAMPTITHAWHRPKEECWLAWLLFFMASTLNVAMLPALSSTASAVPVFFMCQTGLIFGSVVCGSCVAARASLQKNHR